MSSNKSLKLQTNIIFYIQLLYWVFHFVGDLNWYKLCEHYLYR
jgi:hypothetical protein